MRKAVFFLLVCLSVFVLIIKFGYGPLSAVLGLKERSGIRVDSTPPSEVAVDNQSLGNTPVQREDLTPGEHLVSLKSDQGSWSGYVKLNSGTLSVVNRDLFSNEASSSGEIITLEPGSGATVISNPSSAEVEVDGKSLGQTPVSLSTLSAGEHLFSISHSGYTPRSVRASLAEGFNLILNVDLALSNADLTQGGVAPEPTPAPSLEGVVKQTPTGFLRVRDQASLNGKIIGQVSSGDTLVILQELPNWDRIQIKDGTVGYVSSQYIQKRSQ